MLKLLGAVVAACSLADSVAVAMPAGRDVPIMSSKVAFRVVASTSRGAARRSLAFARMPASCALRRATYATSMRANFSPSRDRVASVQRSTSNSLSVAVGAMRISMSSSAASLRACASARLRLAKKPRMRNQALPSLDLIADARWATLYRTHFCALRACETWCASLGGCSEDATMESATIERPSDISRGFLH